MRASLASLLLTGCFYATAEKVVVIDDGDVPVAQEDPGEDPGPGDVVEEPTPEGCGEPLVAPEASAPDQDGDGLSDQSEQMIGTRPDRADTDQDGLPDGIETVVGSEPLVPDTDQDQLLDGAEIAACTDPLDADTDGDGLPDGGEVFKGTDPLSADTDGDSLSDGEEVLAGTDPREADSDTDGLSDAEEPQYQTDPLDPDTDDDLLLDGDEILQGSDPHVQDTDGDSLQDGEEVEIGTSPLLDDSDQDGVDDGPELTVGTDPLVQDTDGDGLLDGQEISQGSDPLLGDSDDDGLTDSEEGDLGLDPGVADTDGDGVEDGREVEQGSDPLDAQDLSPDAEPGVAHWQVRYREGVMCSTTGSSAGLWPLMLGAIAVLARSRRSRLARTPLLWGLPLAAGCYYEERSIVEGKTFIPEVVEAYGHCQRSPEGAVWTFGATVEDLDGMDDILLVEARVFDDSGRRRPLVGFELGLVGADEQDQDEEAGQDAQVGEFLIEARTGKLDCEDEGYVAEFVAYDHLLSSQPVSVELEPYRD